jgi:hypothetical protein
MRFIAVFGMILLSGATSFGAEAGKDPEPQEIIRRFAAKEAEFAKARENYTYRQTVNITELDAGGNPQGKYELIEDIVFSAEGKRTEKVVRAPMATLQHILLTPEDEQDLRHVQPFVLTTDQIPNYDIQYLGRQKVDEIGTFAFSVKPKKMEKGKRYFEGQIWVDDRDLQIVKTYGKGVGIVKKGNEFPRFETYREQIDGKYWFPTYTHADDTLHFPEYDQRISMTVKYRDYKQFKSQTNITFGDEATDPGKKPEANPQAPPKK